MKPLKLRMIPTNQPETEGWLWHAATTISLGSYRIVDEPAGKFLHLTIDDPEFAARIEEAEEINRLRASRMSPTSESLPREAPPAEPANVGFSMKTLPAHVRFSEAFYKDLLDWNPQVMRMPMWLTDMKATPPCDPTQPPEPQEPPAEGETWRHRKPLL